MQKEIWDQRGDFQNLIWPACITIALVKISIQ